MVKCNYCGESEATTRIPDPNMKDDDWWDVCGDCKSVIKHQQDLSFGHLIKDIDDSKFSQDYGDKLIAKAKEGLGYTTPESIGNLGE